MLELKDSPYFNTLPIFTQESIMQSGVDFYSEDELRSFVDNLGNA